MRMFQVAAAAAIGAVALAACGSAPHSSGAVKPQRVPIAITTSGVAVMSGDTSLGNGARVAVGPHDLRAHE